MLHANLIIALLKLLLYFIKEKKEKAVTCILREEMITNIIDIKIIFLQQCCKFTLIQYICNNVTKKS